MRRVRVVIFGVLLVIVGAAVVLYAATAGPADGPHRPRAASATALVQRDVVVDGLRLRYVDEGSGPAVILIPGHTSRIEEHERLIAALRGRYRVLVFDYPGSGYSDKPDRDYDLRFYEDVTLGFMDAMGIERCALVGGSLGGNLALRLAHRAPERVTMVAVWGPASAWEPMPVKTAFMRVFGGRVLFWPTVRIQATYWHSDGWAGKDAAMADVFAYYREVMSPAFVRMYWGMAIDQMERSLFGIARDIRQPTLLMLGDRDHGFGMGSGVRRLHKEMPDSRLIVYPDVGHSVSDERPDELAAAIGEFLAVTDGVPSPKP